MNREEVLQSISLKKRFCKNNSFPISVFDNPYFLERLQDLDIVFGCIGLFDEYCEDLERYKTEQEYFENYNKVKENAINAIKNNDAFSRFISECNERASEVFRKDCLKLVHIQANRHLVQNLYAAGNSDGSFISIDMKRANFTTMQHFFPEIFDDCSTWEQFIGQFTNDIHIINSKYVRQVIMGACNPRRQIEYERTIMNWLCDYLIEYYPSISVYSVSNDEIIIKVEENMGFSLNQLRKTVSEFPILDADAFRVSSFELSAIWGTDGWLKIYNQNDSKVEFKCVGTDIFNQVVKYYYDKPINENDLVFHYNGRLARFLNPIDNPWE